MCDSDSEARGFVSCDVLQVEFDVLLCSGSGINVVCKVPNKRASATAVKDFVHEFCFLVSAR